MDFEKQLAAFKAFFEGKVDFAGQAKTDQLTRQILWTTGVIAFLVGFALQSLQVTFGIFTAGIVGCCAVVLPSYPTYNSHPVQWLPTLPASEGASVEGEERKKDR